MGYINTHIQDINSGGIDNNNDREDKDEEQKVAKMRVEPRGNTNQCKEVDQKQWQCNDSSCAH